MAFNRRVRRNIQQLRQKNIALRKQARRSKFSIPQVNQNPQPPNASSSTTTTTASNPSSSFTVGPLAPATDPRDSQYYRDLSQIEFDKSQSISNLNLQDTQSKTAYEQALQARSFQEPIETQRLREGANVGGMIYSSAHQEDLGNLAKQQFQVDTGIESDYRNQLAQRALQRQGVEGQYQINLQQYLADSADRAAQAELDRQPPLVDELQAQIDANPGNPNNVALLARIHQLQQRRSTVTSKTKKQAITKTIHKLQQKRR